MRSTSVGPGIGTLVFMPSLSHMPALWLSSGQVSRLGLYSLAKHAMIEPQPELFQMLIGKNADC